MNRRLTRKKRLKVWCYFYLGPLLLNVACVVLAKEIQSIYGLAIGLYFLFTSYVGSALLYGLYLRQSSWKGAKTRFSSLASKAREKHRSISVGRVSIATGIYLLLFIPLAYLYLRVAQADQYFSETAKQFLNQNSRLAVVVIILIAYLYGLVIRDVLRYRCRMFAAPLVFLNILLLMLVVMMAAGPGKDWVHEFLLIVKDHFWAVVVLVAILIWRPQIGSILPRIRKAELPGGSKVEIAELEELQNQINPWKKTVSRFADLMDWVGKLIIDTPPDDIVKLLAYTPALGFLTRTEADWRRLHKLLVERTNIQIICLREDYLEQWHADFKNKRTTRPEGIIHEKLIERANRISKEIVADKKRQVDSKMQHVIEKTWDEMPGYYLFANSKRAIIAAPLFLPNDPFKPDIQGEADNYLGNTPVKMLGFESSDTWTVWLVNQVCDYYAKAKVAVPAPAVDGGPAANGKPPVNGKPAVNGDPSVKSDPAVNAETSTTDTVT